MTVQRDTSIRNPEDRAKLPLWAQRQIEGLLAQNGQLIKAQNAGPEDSDTFIDPYLDDWRKPLGKGKIIRFGGQGYENTFDVSYADGELEVQGNVEGTDFVILPKSGNRIVLAFVPSR